MDFCWEFLSYAYLGLTQLPTYTLGLEALFIFVSGAIWKLLSLFRWTVRADTLQKILDNYGDLIKFWPIILADTADQGSIAKLIGVQSKIRKDVQVGNNVSIGDNVTVAKKSQIGDDVQIGNGTIIRKDVVIGAGAIIGNNVTIRNGATILPGATVPDGTVVPKNSTFP